MPKLVLLHTNTSWWYSIQLRDSLRKRYPGLEVTSRAAPMSGATILHRPGDQRDLDEAQQLAKALTARFGTTRDARTDRYTVDKVLVLSECPLCRRRDLGAQHVF